MRSKVAAIYAIRHLTTGKMYIGSSVDVAHRITAHYSSLRLGNHHCIQLQRAWNKYGEDQFDWYIEFPCMLGDDLFLIEQGYLDCLFDDGILYNSNRFAATCRGSKQSAETKRKRAEKLRGTKRTPEQCKRISEARKLVGISPEHQRRLNEISAARRFKMTKEEAEECVSAYMAGAKWGDVLASYPNHTKAVRHAIKSALGISELPKR